MNKAYYTSHYLGSDTKLNPFSSLFCIYLSERASVAELHLQKSRARSYK